MALSTTDQVFLETISRVAARHNTTEIMRNVTNDLEQLMLLRDAARMLMSAPTEFVANCALYDMRNALEAMTS